MGLCLSNSFRRRVITSWQFHRAEYCTSAAHSLRQEIGFVFKTFENQNYSNLRKKTPNDAESKGKQLFCLSVNEADFGFQAAFNKKIYARYVQFNSEKISRFFSLLFSPYHVEPLCSFLLFHKLVDSVREQPQPASLNIKGRSKD